MTKKLPDNPMVAAGAGPENLWYVPDRRIRTEPAARRAIAVARWIATGQGLQTDPDETTLFVALHTCAYRATRQPRNKRVSPAKRHEWVRRWKVIREHIVEKNLGLVYSMIHRYGSHELHEDDLLSEGMYGLARAVERFDPWKGYRFSTYACNAIARATMRRRRQETLHRQRFTNQPEEYCYEEINDESDPTTDLYLERLQRTLDENLGELTDLESKILARRFPSGRSPQLTYQEIGEAVGLSKERVRQIQNVALAKLREALALDPVLQ